MNAQAAPFPEGGPIQEPARALVRHEFATIAYRAGLALRDAPAGFADFAAGNDVRTPLALVHHLTGLCRFAQGLLCGTPRQEDPPLPWDEAIARFEQALTELDRAVAEAGAWHYAPTAAVQGPLADALTHVGQLVMLRRLAGAPIAGGNYPRAAIRAGELRLGGGAART